MLQVLMREIKTLVENYDPNLEACWERIEMAGEEIILNAEFIAQKYKGEAIWDIKTNKIVFTKEPEDVETCASQIIENMTEIYFDLRNDLLLLFLNLKVEN